MNVHTLLASRPNVVVSTRVDATRRARCERVLRHYLATSGESRRYVVAFTRFTVGSIWLRQESLRHILASSGYAPETIAVNVTWMERCWSNASQHVPIYLQPLPSYSEILVGNCNFFSTPLHLTPLLWCSHWNSGTNLVNGNSEN